MHIVVLKFGGSSVGSLERIAHVAELLRKRCQRSRKSRVSPKGFVVVVSAMRGETDRLLALAQSMSKRPNLRETDQILATGEQVAASLLAMALVDRGVPARSMSGSQMRLLTDGTYSKARIVGLDKNAILSVLKQGEVVVATGFQGIDAKGNLTTLGRGGSDTSAVAIAAGLGASSCDIYTDVDGVYTADPNICPNARKLTHITFDEMMEMASLGSKVLQIRSVELAMNHTMPIRVRSTFSKHAHKDVDGTLVAGQSPNDPLEKMVVRGISHNKHETRFTLRGLPDKPGVAARIFSALAKAGVNVNVIVQLGVSSSQKTGITFTVVSTEADATQSVLEKITRDKNSLERNDASGTVSIVGVGMMAHPGVAATMFESLAAAGINIDAISTSEIKVTCVIAKKDVDKAVNTLHQAFELHKKPTASKKRRP